MKEVAVNLIVNQKKFAIVISRFNDLLTKQLLGGAEDCLIRHGAASDDITAIWVPGANELPQVVKKVSSKGGFDAVIALGAVVQGATPHADLINSQVAKTLSQIAIDTGVPVINGVVCASSLDQAIERCGTKAGNKGWQAAQAAIEMANIVESLEA